MSEIVVSKGGKATFSCELPDASYQGVWVGNGSTMQHDGKRIVISQSGGEHTLVISGTKKEDEGKIVFKTNTGGVEVPFQLIVTEPPSIDPEEFQKSAEALGQLKIGSPMVLRVPFSGASPITASWKFNGKPVSSGRYQIESSNSETKLTIVSFQAEDCGTYETTLKNQFGEMKVPVDVSLSETSKVSFETVNVPGQTVQKTSTMVIGGDVEIPSKPSGNIKFDNMAANLFAITFVTTSKGDDVSEYVIEANGGAGWNKCATFRPGDKAVRISDLEVGKRYTFRIKATNAAGESEGLESRAVTVQKPSQSPVLDAGVLEKMKGDQFLKSGKDFRLKIPYVGFPLPIAQWSKNGKKITARGRIASETSDVDTMFAISGLGADDSGEYTLVLKNKGGSATAKVNIVIIDVPSQPGGPVEMSDVTSTAMTFAWKPPKSDGGRPLKGFIVDRKDSKSPMWTELGRVSPDTLSYTSDGLTKGLKYSFRIRAFSEEGESKPLTSQLTLASGPPGPPGAPVASKVTSSSIEVKWSAPSNDGGSAVTAYYAEYREVGGDWNVIGSSGIDGLTAKRDNLTAESDYEFKVCAKNSTGKSPWSQTQKPITAMDAPEPPVISDSARENLATPVTFKTGDDVVIKVPVSGIPKPTAVWSYKGKELKPEDGRFVSTVSKAGVQLAFPDAKRSDSGKYSVQLKNMEGETAADVTLKVTDVPMAPGGPVKVIKASSKSLTVGWAPPSDDGGLSLVQYLIEKQTCGDDEWTRVGKVFPGEDLKISTDHVEKGKSYVFRINCQNSIGNSPYLTSNEIAADDKYKPPAQIGAPVVSDVTKTSCVVTWEEPDDGGSAINGYILELKRIGRRNWIPQHGGRLISDRTFKVKDLSQGYEYQFRVAAENEGGSGPTGKESDVIMAKDPIPPPPPPTDLEVEDMTDKTVSLKWQAPKDLEPTLFNGYFVERCEEGSDKWIACNDFPIRSTRYKVEGLKTGSKFNFRIRPVNDGGHGQACGFGSFREIKQWHEQPKISFDSSLKQTVEVQASSTLRLIASISGRPRPVIRWSKQGIDLDKRGLISVQDGVCTLTIRNLAKSDSGTYELTADNPSGTIRKAVNLVVKDAPDPPCNIKLGEIQDDGSLLISWDPPANNGGNAIKHYCIQKRDAYSRSFQTIKDKVTGTSYLVRDLKPGCTYYFRIIAENEMGRGDGSQSNLLTVVQKRGPLKIEKMSYNKMNLTKGANINLALKPIRVKERATAKFTCATVGKPDPEVAWYKDNVRIHANNKYSMINNYGVCTLTIFDCRARDAAMYKVEVTNPTGKAVSEANLAVLTL